MASKARINKGALANLRTSPKVRDALEDMAARAVDELSEGGRVEGYSYTVQHPRGARAAVSIVGKGHARNDARKHNKLLRALDSLSQDMTSNPKGDK